MSDKTGDRQVVFDDGDDGKLGIDDWSDNTVCMTIKTRIGTGICTVRRDKNPKIFNAVHALYRAIEIEQNS